METNSPFMSGWDDPQTVTKRLRPALQSRGVMSHSSEIADSVLSPWPGQSGFSGEMALLTLSLYGADDNMDRAKKTLKFVLKRTRSTEQGRLTAKRLGSYREAAFYNTISPWLEERLGEISRSMSHQIVPKALFAASDPETGQKAIVLDLYENAVEAGAFYSSPIHVRKDDLKLPPFSQRSVTLAATRMAAILHGASYRDTSLLTDPKLKSNLRMSDWIQGLGRESFLSTQREVCERWAKAKSLTDELCSQVEMKKEFIAAMDTSIALATEFDAFVDMWGVRQHNISAINGIKTSTGKIGWSLVHGDFHPGNILCFHSHSSAGNLLTEEAVEDNTRPRLVLLDWEHVGVGSGLQDIGQYLISHVETQEACDSLDEIVSIYRSTLVETLQRINPPCDIDVPSLEDLKSELIYGGLQRWIWLYSFMCGITIPPAYMQYFHDQMYRWMVANDVRPENVGMPRP
ncbi:hypothetical protein ACHAWF_018011 [Thalassiosira exigua]